MTITVVRLPLSQLRLDGGTQPREKIDELTIAEYAEAMLAGADFPPIVAFFDGTAYWVADGHHRVRAAAKAGLAEIVVDVRSGTRDAAVWFACAANATHGLRRSNADKRRAVETALRLRPDLSDRVLADHCGIGKDMVGDVRRTMQLSESDSSKRVGKDGKARSTSSVKRSAAARTQPEQGGHVMEESPPATAPAVVTPLPPLALEQSESDDEHLAINLVVRRPMSMRRVLDRALMLSPDERRALARMVAWHSFDDWVVDGGGD